MALHNSAVRPFAAIMNALLAEPLLGGPATGARLYTRVICTFHVHFMYKCRTGWTP